MKSYQESILKSFKDKTVPIEDIEQIEDVCIHVVDCDGNIVCYSKGCEIIENTKREEVIGKNMSEIYNYLENESMELKVLQTGKVVKDVHVKYTSPTGKVADVISSTYPVFSREDSKKVEAAICIYRDISDYIHMGNTIKKLQADLKSQQVKNNGTQYTFEDIIGKSESIKECIHHATIAAETVAPILIAGPTGTGKEVFAQSIHNGSSQIKKPFVAINCSAIPENLLESTLFGTVKGSFTGAIDSKGLLETADGGTVFLDEINSMPLELQAKLLRVLETGFYRKVGGNKEIKADIRVLSALNQDPLQAVEEKRLRLDLYYRLAVFSIHLPALKDRKEDILPMVDLFLEKDGKMMGKKLFEVSDEAKEILFAHDWPGNVRELKHVITHAIFISQQHETVLVPDLLPSYLKKDYLNRKIIEKYSDKVDHDQELKDIMAKIERSIISEALEELNYNVSKTAKKLGISRQNLQHKMKIYEMKKGVVG
ncbi:sigma 54-interacting transcriptional regulator [Eubacteriaceae bacterium ES2]|nr:sigma 54-interacting transcriptional regulator [Eubacteriaceae bacterium ES2]